MGRSKWKGPYSVISETGNEKLKELPRNFEIVPSIVGQNFKAYNGKKFLKVSINFDMIGHKIGEFCPTRERFEFKKKKKKTK